LNDIIIYPCIHKCIISSRDNGVERVADHVNRSIRTGSNKFCLDVDGITIKRPGDMQSVFQIPLTAALASGRVSVTDLEAARWHERVCRINGSERNSDENGVGTSPVRPLGKIARWIGVGNCLGSGLD
jgi:hypothetical protein